MQHNRLHIITLAICLFLFGCATDMGKNEATGTAVGALAGGAAGYGIGGIFGKKGKLIGGLVGALAGGVLGNRLGEYLDEQDYQNIYRVLSEPDTQPKVWCSGSRSISVTPLSCEGTNQVTVTPTPITVSPTGQQCRDYTTEVQTPEGPKTVTDRACRDKDGNWKSGQTAAYRDVEGHLDESI